MALDIGLATVQNPGQEYPSHRLSFDDDGYYWFCRPAFEDLCAKTGQLIDLYGGAWFRGPQLLTLKETVERLFDKIGQMPEEWDVITGYSIGSHLQPTLPTEVRSRVDRKMFLELLKTFSDAIVEAEASGQWLACLGD
jgi:hypothetical protein